MEYDVPNVTLLDAYDVQVWNAVYWAEVERRITPIFARSDALARAMAYLAGLLSPAERKNSWQLAEISGAANPYGFQHLLGRADWHPDALRDCLRTYITDYLMDNEAVGVIDETGFLKKGQHSAGVARQYSGTAGRIENSQIGVFLAYASQYGHTLLDRELYLPVEWTADPTRCAHAGIPTDHAFATKPALAQQMLARAVAANVTFAWLTGDSVYGDDPTLRQWLEARGQAYVLAISQDTMVWIGHTQYTVATLLATVPTDGWVCLSAGVGSKGSRWYEWQQIALPATAAVGHQRWLLFRRNLHDPSKVAAYLVFGPGMSGLATHVRVAGMRWTVEESIQTAKGEVGLDQYEVRSWTGWYRHITLAMWAQAFLTVLRREMGSEECVKKGLQNPTKPRRMAIFKARRGLRSD
jgi:SRSO17 transposase